jgi:hypothetical protein
VDYDLAGSSSTIFPPQATIETRFSPVWTATAAVGLLLLDTSTAATGSRSSVGLSADVNGCRRDDRSSLCFVLRRNATPSGLGDVLTQLTGGAAYGYRLGERSNLNASLNYSVVDQSEIDSPSTSYVGASLSYDQGISKRLTAGASVAYRDIFGTGRDVAADFSGQIFIRAVIGQFR